MAMDVPYGFVVLHYMAYEMTLRCAEALLALDGTKHIVIVDNASPNGSGQKLKEHFGERADVTVLLSPANEGFARGNNLGYSYLREHFSCEFITVLNNDVLIPDRDFPARVKALYEAAPFAVLGPDILNPATGIHQNPAHLKGFTPQEVQERLEKYRKNFPHFRWKHFKWRIKKAFSPAPVPQKVFYREPLEDVVLHGACYIFSKDFIVPRSYCFHPGTFLYFEEDILHYECLQAGLKLRYNPSLQVLHLEDVATNAALRSNTRKEEMKLRESIRSMQVLLTLMNS